MAQVDINIDQRFFDFIEKQGRAQGVSRTQIVDCILKNGIAIASLSGNPPINSDPRLTNIIRNIICAAISFNNNNKFKLETLSPHQKERWERMDEILKESRGKIGTTVSVSEKLGLFLRDSAKSLNKSISFVFFVYLQCSLVGRFIYYNRSESAPNLERLDEILNFVKHSTTHFEYDKNGKIETHLLRRENEVNMSKNLNNLKEDIPLEVELNLNNLKEGIPLNVELNINDANRLPRLVSTDDNSLPKELIYNV